LEESQEEGKIYFNDLIEQNSKEARELIMNTSSKLLGKARKI
jgi:hypothetical protein